MGRFSRRDGAVGFLVVNAIAAAVVGLTLVLNLARGYPIASLAAAAAIAGWLYWLWVLAGRPRGVSQVDRLAEQELGEETDPDADAMGSAGG
jgi:membrane protein implicated in regulation of membrane protease activity